MKRIFLFLLLIIAQSLNAQKFTEVSYFNDFEGVKGAAIAVADFNGDAFPDMWITGQKTYDDRSSKIYLNNGKGQFSEIAAPKYSGMKFGKMAVADVNGDQCPDVILSGRIDSNRPSTNLYLNDGSGQFTKAKDTPFLGVVKGTITLTDLNGDQYPDVFLTGDKGSGKGNVAKLYLNNGKGHFTEVANTPFEGVRHSAVAIGDVNGDQYPDLFISGQKFLPGERWQGDYLTQLFLSDGKGQFTLMENMPFEDMSSSTAAMADLNGDQHLDIIISGADEKLVGGTKLYLNDGTGQFSESINLPFAKYKFSTINVADLNGDQSPDLLFTGDGDVYKEGTKLYLNNGTGQFQETTAHPFVDVLSGAVATMDMNGDGYPEVLITGTNGGIPSTQLYTSNAKWQFKKVTEKTFGSIQYGAVAIADMNGDQHPDVFVTGRGETSANRASSMSRLYHNNGEGNFTEVTGMPFPAVQNSTIAIADVNKDQLPDLLLAGDEKDAGAITRLYLNDETKGLVEVPDTPFEGVLSGAVAMEDVDGDGYADVLISGKTKTKEIITKLYINKKVGGFKDAKTPFVGVYLGAIALSDINGDQYPDVLLTGKDNSEKPITRLYTNNGKGRFTEVKNTPFVDVHLSAVAIADINGDQYPDILISGQNGSRKPLTTFYLNDGKGAFKKASTTPFMDVFGGDIAVADINGDTYPDVLLTGNENWDKAHTILYLNDGKGGFTPLTDTPFIGVGWGGVAVGDVNGDQLVDLLIAGLAKDKFGKGDFNLTRLYLNEGN